MGCAQAQCLWRCVLGWELRQNSWEPTSIHWNIRRVAAVRDRFVTLIMEEELASCLNGPELDRRHPGNANLAVCRLQRSGHPRERCSRIWRHRLERPVRQAFRSLLMCCVPSGSVRHRLIPRCVLASGGSPPMRKSLKRAPFSRMLCIP